MGSSTIQDAVELLKHPDTRDPQHWAELLWEHGYPREIVENADPFLLRLFESRTLPERYQLLDVVDQGGMGCIFLAYDHKLDRKIALKRELTQSHDAANPALRKTTAQEQYGRFEKEVKLAAKLSHHGIVPIHDLIEDVYGHPMGVMRVLPNQTLDSAIDEFHEQSDFDQRRFRELIRHLIAVGQTVSYMHSKDVIHRDIKPKNIIVGEFSEVYLIDFGLALELPFDGPVTGEGSEGFMAPEQALGKPEPASDVFSLGATLYQIISGHAPTKTFSDNRLPKNRRVSRQLRAICAKAMSPKVNDRYQDPAAMADDLEEYLGDRPVLATRDTVFEKMTRLARKNPRVILTVGGALLACIVILTVSLSFVNEARLDEAEQKQRANRLAEVSVETMTDVIDSVGSPMLLQPETLPLHEQLVNKIAEFHRRLNDEGLSMVGLKLSQQSDIIYQQSSLKRFAARQLAKRIDAAQTAEEKEELIQKRKDLLQACNQELTEALDLARQYYDENPQDGAERYFVLKQIEISAIKDKDQFEEALDGFVDQIKSEMKARPNERLGRPLGEALTIQMEILKDRDLAYQKGIEAFRLLRNEKGAGLFPVTRELASTKYLNREFYSAVSLLDEQFSAVQQDSWGPFQHVSVYRKGIPAFYQLQIESCFEMRDLLSAQGYARLLLEAIEQQSPGRLGFNDAKLSKLLFFAVTIEAVLNGPPAARKLALQLRDHSNSMRTKNTADPMIYTQAIEAETILGFGDLDLGQPQSAKSHFEACLELCEEASKSYPKYKQMFQPRIPFYQQWVNNCERTAEGLTELKEYNDVAICKTFIRWAVSKGDHDKATRLFELLEGFEAVEFPKKS